MKKTDINPMPEYFDRYINKVEAVELKQAFADSNQQLKFLDKNWLIALDDKSYAPGKWTVREIFQHLIDWERIFCYRALIISRGESSAVQSVDENLLAANMNANRRTVAGLIDELRLVRAATAMLFESFEEQMLFRKGICGNSEMSVLSMGFTIVGHQIHHFQIIEEKYYQLVR